MTVLDPTNASIFLQSRSKSCRASRNLSCSGSVQLSLDLVIVYGFRTFLVGSSGEDVADAVVGSVAEGPSPGNAIPFRSK
uniref:DNA binding protein n=1 Tax=Rhizophora mucronata TaxID=61149 RepID=A0A2P2KBC0_RHIMU